MGITAMNVPECVDLELPEAPSANRWWRMGRSGPNGGPRHMILSAEARAYKQIVELKIGSAMRPIHGARIWPVYPPKLALEIWISWFRSRRAGDLDKRVGILLDALQGTLYASDAQLVQIHAFRDEDPDGIGRMLISVRPAAVSEHRLPTIAPPAAASDA